MDRVSTRGAPTRGLSSRVRSGRGRRLGLGLATLAILLAAAAPAQANPFAYVANLSGDNVSQYDVGAGGLLAPLAPPTVATGGAPQGVAVSPDGESVYVAGGFSPGSVSQYDVGAGGALSPKSPAFVDTGSLPQGVAVSPDGKSAYVTNVISDNVSQYDVGAGGALSPKSPPAVPAGAGPFGVAVSPAPGVPTTKEQCKNGGWQSFPSFKNQGQCIKFVQHGP